MEKQKRTVLPRSAKKTSKLMTSTRRMINEVDIYERENIEVESETLKPTELYDEDDDTSGNVLYKQLGAYKPRKLLDKPSHLNPVVQLEELNNVNKNTPRKQKVPEDKFMKGFSSDEESVSEGSLYEPLGSDDDNDDDYNEEDNDYSNENSTEEIENADDISGFMTDKEVDNKIFNNKMEVDIDEENDTEEMTDRSEFEDDESQSENERRQKMESKSKRIAVPSKISSTENDYTDLHLNTEEYFETQSEKVLTSNRTLGRLKTSKLDKETIDKLLKKNLHISEEHSDGILRLNHRNVSLFPFWNFLLEEGFSVLLHGLGSKRKLIQDFHKKVVKGCPTLFVNGFFPSLTLKEILDGIIKDLMELEVPTSVNECMDLIEQTLKKYPDDRIYLLIHNIDGPMLRSKKIQDKLSYLANIPNLHLIASVDHINASLLWDNAKRSRFNFYWCNVTTFLPYKEETLYENSLMVRQSGALALSSLHNVFLSLPDKSRSVYTILVKYQIENAGANYPGMAFKDLYQKAREGFFVTNDVTLRSQLTEFLDHKLVKEKRGVDGIQYLNIPLDNALLKQFLEQQES